MIGRRFATGIRRMATGQSSDALYLHPEKWQNLPSEKIFKLFEERVLKLGPDYKKDANELKALLNTSKDSGVSVAEIRRVYNLNEKRPSSHSSELIAGKLSGVNPLKEGQIDSYQFDEYSSTAQDVIDQHKTVREYNRIAAYELPLLAQYRKAYDGTKAKQNKPLRVRYTTYIGESHLGERKVVIKSDFAEFAREYKLNDKQQHVLKLLLGKRYNPIKDEIHLSLEQFKYPTQNLKKLLTTLATLVKEAKVERTGDDDFSDLPLDPRLFSKQMKKVAKEKKINSFPEEWLRPQDAPEQKVNLETEIVSELENVHRK